MSSDFEAVKRKKRIGGHSSRLVSQNLTKSHVSPCLVSGYLVKLNTGIFGSSEEKFAVIEGGALKWYSDSLREEMQGFIDFQRGGWTVKIENKSMPTVFSVRNSHTKHQFKAKSPMELRQWAVELSILTRQTQDQMGQELKRISIRDFERVADTGDLLLFKSTAVGSQLQRAFTRSEYDHVAIILHFSSGRLMVLESMRDSGVNMVEWASFVEKDWFKYYDRIVHRRLFCKRDSSMA